MPNDNTRVEIITGRERRRRYTANEKLALVDATMQPGMTVSAVARLNGVLSEPALQVEATHVTGRSGRRQSR
jgi:transposase-like protein